MKHLKPIWLLTFYLFAIKGYSQVPKIGDSLQLEIANWNLEWFGKAGYGPTDEALQQNNVLKVIQNADVDIWTFCEVSNTKVFDSLMLKLPAYGYAICNYLPEQKTAIIFKKNQFALLKSELLGTDNPDSFTTLRYPFQVTLKPLIPIGIDTLYLIALHLKANIGNSSELLAAYNSRLRSGEWLKMYLNKTHVNHHCIVLGDWNDDLDQSIYNNLPSPYANLQDIDFKFDFITKKFTDSHSGTTTSYTDAIDHQLISLQLKSYFIPNSTKLFYLNNYIPNYASTTSDHYPVYSLFSRHSSNIYNKFINYNCKLYPNPCTNGFNITSNDYDANYSVKIMDTNGHILYSEVVKQGEIINTEHLSSGLYQIIISGKLLDNYTSLLLINH